MTDGSVTAAAPLHTLLVIEIAKGRQPLAGTIRPLGGSDTRFSGWLELAAAIERLRLQDDEAPPARCT